MKRATEARRIIVCIALFLPAYFFAEIFLFIFKLVVGPAKRTPHEITAFMAAFHTIVLGACAALLLFRRPATGHPATNAPYREWLKSTPWDYTQPLPLSPGVIAPIDFAMLIALCVLECIVKPALPLITIIAASAGFFVGCIGPLSHMKQRHALRAVMMLGSLLVWLVPNWNWMMPVSFAILIIGDFGLHRGLRKFPWEEKAEAQVRWVPEIPADLEPRVSFTDGLVRSVLIASWFGAIGRIFDWTFVTLCGIYLVIACVVPLGRLAIYLSKTVAPMNWRGRIKRGRLLIWGYDKVFAAPLLSAITAVAIFEVFKREHRGVELLTVGTFATLAVNQLSGPTLRTWELTGFFSRKVR